MYMIVYSNMNHMYIGLLDPILYALTKYTANQTDIIRHYVDNGISSFNNKFYEKINYSRLHTLPYLS